MDIREVDPPGAMARPKIDQDNVRPPLLPSEKNNGIPVNRKPRDVASRYKDGIPSASFSRPSSPKRLFSPNATRSFPAPELSVPKRAQSAERRRPMPAFSAPLSPSKASTPSSPSSPRSTTPVRDPVIGMHSSMRRSISNKTLDSLWPSIRSQSSSLQSESTTFFADTNERLVGLERKTTPLRGRNISDQLENSKPSENSNTRAIDQHRWPGMLGGRLSTNVLSKSVDHSHKIYRSNSLLFSSRVDSPNGTSNSSEQLSLSEAAEQLFDDGDGKLERDMKSLVNSSTLPSDKYPIVLRPIRTHTSPISPTPVLHRPSSSSKLLSSSTSRGMLTPSRTGPSTSISSYGSVSSFHNYSVDIRKGKRSASHLEDAHQLRLLQNVNLQWQFVNAQSEKTLAIQKIRTESALYSVWSSISKLRDSVAVKRINVEYLHQEMKLHTILKEQIAYLQDFAALEKGHDNAVVGTVKALKATTLRLPVIGGARANVVDVKNAVTSAVDIMQSMGSSICYLLSKVEGTKSLFFELSAIAAEERFMLDDCREFLTAAAAIQVQESSLRTQIMQLRREALKLE